MSGSIFTTYDSAVDAAYIILRKLKPGEKVRTYACDVEEVGGMINLDFDQEGRLVGIEVLDATALLPVRFISDQGD